MVAEPGPRDGPSVGIPKSGVHPRMKGNLEGNLGVSPRGSAAERHGHVWSLNTQGRWQKEGEVEVDTKEEKEERGNEADGVVERVESQEGRIRELEVRLSVVHTHHTMVEAQIRGKVEELEKRLQRVSAQGGVVDSPPGLPPGLEVVSEKPEGNKEGTTERVIMIPRSCTPRVMGTKVLMSERLKAGLG